jgi:hypothetical protein
LNCWQLLLLKLKLIQLLPFEWELNGHEYLSGWCQLMVYVVSYSCEDDGCLGTWGAVWVKEDDRMGNIWSQKRTVERIYVLDSIFYDVLKAGMCFSL